MSKKDERTKPKYEAPTVVALGELAQGLGYCAAGSSALEYCTAGTAAATACTAGSVAVSAACTTGGAPGA